MKKNNITKALAEFATVAAVAITTVNPIVETANAGTVIGGSINGTTTAASGPIVSGTSATFLSVVPSYGNWYYTGSTSQCRWWNWWWGVCGAYTYVYNYSRSVYYPPQYFTVPSNVHQISVTLIPYDSSTGIVATFPGNVLAGQTLAVYVTTNDTSSSSTCYSNGGWWWWNSSSYCYTTNSNVVGSLVELANNNTILVSSNGYISPLSSSSLIVMAPIDGYGGSSSVESGTVSFTSPQGWYNTVGGWWNVAQLPIYSEDFECWSWWWGSGCGWQTNWHGNLMFPSSASVSINTSLNPAAVIINWQ